MGYAKYGEDIREQIDLNHVKLAPEIYIPKLRPVLAISKCIYCNDEFQTDDELFEHMRLNHNNLSTVIQLNGRILEPGEYIETAIESLKLFPVNNIDLFVLNGKPRKAVIRNGYIDLKLYQRNDFENLTIEISGQRWVVYRSGICTASPKVSVIIDKLNNSAVNRERPDLNAINDDIARYKLDIRDRQYVNGFFEYSLASVIDDAEKDRLYFGAYNKLLPYIETDSRARLITKIICLRYLWIDRLAELCRISKPNEFSLVCDFFSDIPKSALFTEESQSDRIFEVFVEDDEYRNTQEIVNFMNKQYNAVKRYLGEAVRQAENEDFGVNLADKIFLLKARLSECDGEIEKAQYYFKKIRSPSIKRRIEVYN